MAPCWGGRGDFSLTKEERERVFTDKRRERERLFSTDKRRVWKSSEMIEVQQRLT